MADRCFVYRFEPLQATGAAGAFQLVMACNFIHEGATQIREANAVADITDSMTPAQIMNAAVTAIVNMARDSGYTIAANGNQIFMPTLTKA
jgi:hypothetical protein